MSDGELPGFVVKLEGYQGDVHTVRALRLLMLTATMRAAGILMSSSASLGTSKATACVPRVTASLLSGYGELPSLDGRNSSMILQDTSHTRLGEAARPMVQAYPGKLGVFALSDGRDAFAARVLLAFVAGLSVLPIEWLL